MPLFGKIGPAKCQCSQGWDAMWFIKEAGMVCSNCGRIREISVPPQGIMTMPCQCSAGKDATWFVTAKGNYVCSNCGRSR
jgi:hypothetical protein